MGSLGVKQFLTLQTLIGVDADQLPLQKIGKKVEVTVEYWGIFFNRCLATSSCVSLCTVVPRERIDSSGELMGLLCLSFNF